MTVTGHIQGHRVTWTGKRWEFDDGTPVPDWRGEQPACKACGRKPIPLELSFPTGLSPGHVRTDVRDVDACIAALVQVLNEGGVLTVASCCGHKRRPGNIALADGRELIIAPDWETARAVDRAFPTIHGGR